jgi:hypothetical protein
LRRKKEGRGKEGAPSTLRKLNNKREGSSDDPNRKTRWLKNGLMLPHGYTRDGIIKVGKGS